jgi:hypothetical protein
VLETRSQACLQQHWTGDESIRHQFDEFPVSIFEPVRAVRVQDLLIEQPPDSTFRANPTTKYSLPLSKLRNSTKLYTARRFL